MSVGTVDPSASFPKPSISHLHEVSRSLGEFDRFGDVLMVPAILAAVFVSIRPLCACMCMPDAFMSFPGLCAFSGRNFGV